MWHEATEREGKLPCDGSIDDAEYRGCRDAVRRLAVHYAAWQSLDLQSSIRASGAAKCPAS